MENLAMVLRAAQSMGRACGKVCQRIALKSCLGPYSMRNLLIICTRTICDAPVRLDLRRVLLHRVLRKERKQRIAQALPPQRQQRVGQRPRHARVQQLAEAGHRRLKQLRAGTVQ